MPWHGVYPPPGWQVGGYELTTHLYVETVRAVVRALALERPVVMGCSIGGRIVLQLANDHGAEFRALIGVEVADYQAPWYDTSWLYPATSTGAKYARHLSPVWWRLKAPLSTATKPYGSTCRADPGVPGDLYFYRVDGDLRGKLGNIDTAATPLYLLTGEYDFSCTPEDTRRTAAGIPGAEVVEMKEVGHFPMSENPAQFRHYLLPVLDRIHARG